ncbi:hypothetical protein B7463_g8502, partial [Scytalidium lignicola]
MPFYHPLYSTNERIQIRLCSLLPANFESTIKCNIENFDLNYELEFEALSYTWGNPTERIPIEVNDETMLVTKNLATALVYLRNKSNSRSLWVDAICINQDDVDERSAQVASMVKIYRSAKRVISWLGIRDSFFDPFIEMEYATLLFRHIRFLKEYPPFQKYVESNGSQKPYSGFQDHKDTFNNGIYSLQLLIGEREREKPEYWQRAWIIQEVASARALILQSGPYVISEEDIDLVTNFISCPKIAFLMDGRYEQRKLRSHLQSNFFVPISIYRSLLYPNEEDKEKRAARICGSLKLLTLLRHNRSRFCADKRDKVYSVLGLSDLTNSNHPAILIDYKKSIPKVYIETVQAIIQSSSSLEVLCSANLSETTSLSLPSWVPNWGSFRSSDTCDRPISYKHQNAAGTFLSNCRFRIDGTTHILSATGFCFGSILGFKDPFVKFDVDMAGDDALSRLLNYSSLYQQLSQAYKDMAKLLHPKLLSANLFRYTCSLGLLHYDINDSFQSLMDNLELNTDSDQIYPRPCNFSGNRFRFKLMASSINAQCIFAMQASSLSNSANFADSMIGIAPPGVLQNGDSVCILLGCSAPLILRPVENRYLLVCAAYVDSVMDGSAMVCVNDGLFGLTRFDLE